VIFGFLRKQAITEQVNEAFKGKTVQCPSGVSYGAQIAADMLSELMNISNDRYLSAHILRPLFDAFTGDELPIEVIGHFDDALPDHVFFIDDKMDVFSKSFLQGCLVQQEDKTITVDTDFYDVQYRRIQNPTPTIEELAARLYPR